MNKKAEFVSAKMPNWGKDQKQIATAETAGKLSIVV